MNSQELQNHFDEIRESYLNQNLTPGEIGELFGVPRYKINYILEKNNIQKSVSQAKRKYTLDEHYFDLIDTPNKAYILGFLYADGYNNRINNTIVLSLQQKDEDILLSIRDAIGCDKPIFHSDCTSSYDGKERHMSELIIASKHICETMEKFGMPQAKTFLISSPSFFR